MSLGVNNQCGNADAQFFLLLSIRIIEFEWRVKQSIDGRNTVVNFTSSMSMKFVDWRSSIQQLSIIECNRRGWKKTKEKRWIDAETSQRRWVISNRRPLFDAFFFSFFFCRRSGAISIWFIATKYRSVNQRRLTVVNTVEVTRYNQLNWSRGVELTFGYLLVIWSYLKVRLYKWVSWIFSTPFWTCKVIPELNLLCSAASIDWNWFLHTNLSWNSNVISVNLQDSKTNSCVRLNSAGKCRVAFSSIHGLTWLWMNWLTITNNLPELNSGSLEFWRWRLFLFESFHFMFDLWPLIYILI